MTRGAFIVLEGLDRAGKSTQVSMIVEALKERNVPVERRVFPGELWTVVCHCRDKNLRLSALRIITSNVVMPELRLLRHDYRAMQILPRICRLESSFSSNASRTQFAGPMCSSQRLKFKIFTMK